MKWDLQVVLGCDYGDKKVQHTNTPPHQHTNTPTHQCTIAPTHQRTNAPTHQCTNAPAHQCTNAPTQQHTRTMDQVPYSILTLRVRIPAMTFLRFSYPWLLSQEQSYRWNKGLVSYSKLPIPGFYTTNNKAYPDKPGSDATSSTGDRAFRKLAPFVPGTVWNNQVTISLGSAVAEWSQEFLNLTGDEGSYRPPW